MANAKGAQQQERTGDRPAPSRQGEPGKRKGKRIVLFSDGTGNSSAKLFKTNVWRLYDALDVDPIPADPAALAADDPKRGDPVRQIAYYDDGVGTSSFKPMAVLGGALGVGLARNVRDIYAFLCRHYEGETPDKEADEIYGFGFSRGAFTMRVVAGLIARQGVITDAQDESDLQRKVAAAYRQYRSDVYALNSFLAWFVLLLRFLRNGLLWLRNLFLGYDNYTSGQQRPDITFLGLWDTVDAYGLPMDEMTAAWDQYIWPLTMRDYTLHRKVLRARHVLALDDERQTFHPRLWQHDPSDSGIGSIDERRIAQVWFAGVHSNVGGGYSNDSLSFVSLNWMIQRVDRARNLSQGGSTFGLRFHPMKTALYAQSADPLGPIYDSRKGLAGYWRYQPRKFDLLKRQEDRSPIIAAWNRFVGLMPPPVQDRLMSGGVGSSVRKGASAPGQAMTLARVVDPGVQLVHHSVFDRIRAGGNVGYAPLTVETNYRIVTSDASGARIIASNESPAFTYETARDIATRSAARDTVYHIVWLRRVAYFLCLFFTLWLGAFPFLYGIEKTDGNDPTLVSIISAIPAALAGFLPGFFKPWLDAFAANPYTFAKLAGLVVGFLWLGGYLADAISGQLERIWRQHQGPAGIWRFLGLGKGIWNNRLYRFTLYKLKVWVLPFAFALFFLHLGSSLLSRLLFVGSLAGTSQDQASCVSGGVRTELKDFGKEESAEGYRISSMCWSSGIAVQGGRRYEITLTVKEPLEKPAAGVFLGLGVPTWLRLNPMKGDVYGYDYAASGYAYSSTVWTPFAWFRDRLAYVWMQAVMAYRLPMRRNVFEPWLAQHVRVIEAGKSGSDTQTLFPKVPPKMQAEYRGTLVAEFTARRSGEVFLFANEAIGRLGNRGHYYDQNKGSLSVTIKALDWDASYSRH